MFDLSSLFVFPFMLILMRMGSCLMMMPGLSDVAINMRVRVVLAFFITLALFPLLEPTLPPLPEKTSTLVGLVFVEMAIGIMMAISARLFMSAMHVAGEVIAFSSGLQASALFDPSSGGQSTAPALFLTMIGTVLVFATNLHHIIIEGVAQSYNVFPPGNLPPLEDSAYALTRVVSDLFMIGLKIAGPITAIGFLIYAGFGIFNRLIPQLQVFFVAIPITISAGIILLGLTIGGVILLFSEELVNHAILFEQEDNR